MKRSRLFFGLSLLLWSLLMGCQLQLVELEPLPTRAEALVLPIDPTTGSPIPVTFTPVPETAVAHMQGDQSGLLRQPAPNRNAAAHPHKHPCYPNVYADKHSHRYPFWYTDARHQTNKPIQPE